MKKNRYITAIFLTLSCMVLARSAEVTDTQTHRSLLSSDKASSTFEDQLLTQFPSSVGSKIAPAFPGFHSVVKGTEIIFLSDDLSILIKGEVVQLKDGKSLTASLANANKPLLDITKLDLKDAIEFGLGSKVVYVFTDPDCPYCKQLEFELKKLSDTKVYIFLFPLISLHPNARMVAEAIWCAPDPKNAWRDYLLNGVKPKPATCTNPIDRKLTIGQQFQIQGTPTIIFADGSFIPGVVPALRIQAKLDSLQLVKVGASK